MNKAAFSLITAVGVLSLGAVIVGLLPERSPAGAWIPVTEETAKLMEWSNEQQETIPASEPGKLDLNSATVQQLDELPGIGPAKAKAIVDFRTTNGPFRTTEQLMEVKGIGPKIFERLKSFILIGNMRE